MTPRNAGIGPRAGEPIKPELIAARPARRGPEMAKGKRVSLVECEHLLHGLVDVSLGRGSEGESRLDRSPELLPQAGRVSLLFSQLRRLDLACDQHHPRRRGEQDQGRQLEGQHVRCCFAHRDGRDASHQRGSERDGVDGVGEEVVPVVPLSSDDGMHLRSIGDGVENRVNLGDQVLVLGSCRWPRRLSEAGGCVILSKAQPSQI
ncbi:hypothetical protein C4D60_Mb07t19560 [Musa balbisiana]|uniref:Uncharacterized protein n=1 Tax=Musa balbisiana TaxID=52838 RepID=A0A4S8JIG8_MUSBA|nr:hypothetical protein C4D60_Mb07t19560 [Musa balbisiana]